MGNELQGRVTHEDRIRALEQSHVAIAAAQSATTREVETLRQELLGDPTRRDPAGRGALALLQESLTLSHDDLAAQLKQTTTQITAQFKTQTDSLGQQITDVKGKLQTDEAAATAKKTDRRARRFQVFLYLGGGLVLAVTSYLLGLVSQVHP